MAQKKIYLYAVVVGDLGVEGGKTMFVHARNAERAVDFTRRYFKVSKDPTPHRMMKAVRWNRAVPDGAQVHNETDIPWTEA